ncbi:MAG: peptide chain release factor-like protein [Candidatus Gracilibacteria bacterium]|jgi:protein subunit release factor B
MNDFPIPLSPKSLLKAIELKVNVADIEELFIRGSGHGGQKINKTSSTVWLKHKPTGLEVKVQQYREQSVNRRIAYQQLIDKIETLVKGKKSERMKKLFKLRKQKQRRKKRAQEKVLETKKHRGMIKAGRKKDIQF